MYPTIRFEQILFAIYGQSATAQVQVSGQGTTLYTPSRERQGIFIANPPNSTQTLYVSFSNTVAASGVGGMFALLPGQEKYIAANGSVGIFLIAAAAGGLYSIAEIQ